MRNSRERVLVFTATALSAGAAIGAGVALLFAPQSGKLTRRQIRRSVANIGDVARERLLAARR